MEQRRADAAAISHLPNVRYLCGFTGSNAVLYLDGKGATLYTDPRYTIQAAEECDCRVRVVAGPLWPELVKRSRIRRMALEFSHLTHENFIKIKGLTSAVGTNLLDGSNLVEALRAVKDASEISAIRASVVLNSGAFEKVIGRVQPRWTEQRVAAEIDHQMRRMGAEGPAFETIVAAGRHSALPHARPRPEPIGPNRLLLIDMGASLQGYASDMTRVVHLGKAGSRARRLYDAVLEAQLASIAAIRPGAVARDVDAAGRKALKRHALDRFFTHGTGHGLGLEIHEEPRVGKKSDTVLKPGMVITVEPGVYLEGFGGVRIEDTVLVTETGVEVLTPTKKGLLSIT